MATREQVIQDALALSPEDRMIVVEAIDQSLRQNGFATPELAKEWIAEIERRLDAYHRGDVKALSVEESLRAIDERLAEHRSKANGT